MDLEVKAKVKAKVKVKVKAKVKAQVKRRPQKHQPLPAPEASGCGTPPTAHLPPPTNFKRFSPSSHISPSTSRYQGIPGPYRWDLLPCLHTS